MSTRGTIARKTEEGFTGVYHHFDGYPSALGRELWGQYFTNYNGDMEAMSKSIIDDHPAGWSALADEVCYCHPDHGPGDAPVTITEENAGSSGSEYTYILEDSALVIMLPSRRRWLELVRIPWDGNEPDWEQWD